jgi:hypothetical protein
VGYGHHPHRIQAIHQTKGLLHLGCSNVARSDGLLEPPRTIRRGNLQQLVEHFLTPRLAACLGPKHLQLLPLVCGRRPQALPTWTARPTVDEIVLERVRVHFPPPPEISLPTRVEADTLAFVLAIRSGS